MFKRILIKLSGEALKNKSSSTIIDSTTLKPIAEAIKQMSESGVEVAVVIGAGNIFRGKMATQIGIEHSVADYMGMLGTIINSLALQSALENIGVLCKVMSAIHVNAVCEPYIRRKAMAHLSKGEVVIFAGGTGNPYMTTDTTSSLRAIEIEADAIFMAKNGVDGVYDSDPRTNDNAKIIKHLTYKELYEKNLGVMDHTAVSMLKDQDIVTRVFSMNDTSNFMKVLNNDDIGTTISRK